MLMLSTFTVADLSDLNYRPIGGRPKLAPLSGFTESETEEILVVSVEV